MLIKKICGLTKFEDINFCIEHGATHLGFILADGSPRQVSLDILKVLISEIKNGRIYSNAVDLHHPLKFVAVIANNSKKEILEIVKSNLFDILQVHNAGTIEESFFSSVQKEFSVKIWPVLRIQNKEDFKPAKEYWKNYNTFLLDSRQGANSGGSGKIFDWNIIKELYSENNTNKRFGYILAGGINQLILDTIVKSSKQGILKEYPPLGFDLSSGVESSPGIKDKVKLKNVLVLMNEIESLVGNIDY